MADRMTRQGVRNTKHKHFLGAPFIVTREWMYDEVYGAYYEPVYGRVCLHRGCGHVVYER